MYWPSWALESSSPGQFIPHRMIMKGNGIIIGFLLSGGGKNVVVGISPGQEWLLITEQGIPIICFSVYKESPAVPCSSALALHSTCNASVRLCWHFPEPVLST